jgi:uncharacterized protein (TIGR03084 family)
MALAEVLRDLAAESADLDATVTGLPAGDWARPTPAAGWTVAHQIAHLAWTDDQALLAVTDRPAFERGLHRVLAGEQTVDDAARDGARQPPAELLSRWRERRAALATALAAAPVGVRVPWFGPPMSVPSMATARLMETWAHGQDVADALGIVRPPTDRLRHVARLAVRTRDFAFRTRGLTPPAEEFAVRLEAPSGDVWTWGPPDAAQSVTGPAVDLCLVATQRRHRLDTRLVVTGSDADRWLDLAQAFAGPPGPGRRPAGG